MCSKSFQAITGLVKIWDNEYSKGFLAVLYLVRAFTQSQV